MSSWDLVTGAKKKNKTAKQTGVATYSRQKTFSAQSSNKLTSFANLDDVENIDPQSPVPKKQRAKKRHADPAPKLRKRPRKAPPSDLDDLGSAFGALGIMPSTPSKPVFFKGVSKEQIVHRLDNGMVLAQVSACEQDEAFHSQASVLRENIDREFGVADGSEAVVEAAGSNPQAKMLLLMTRNRQAVAMVNMEPIYHAYAATCTEEGDLLYNSRAPVPALCGIECIWVARRHRRKGYGTIMLEAARTHFSFGNAVVNMDLMAFNSPPSSAVPFLTAFWGAQNFLVYSDADIANSGKICWSHNTKQRGEHDMEELD